MAIHTFSFIFLSVLFLFAFILPCMIILCPLVQFLFLNALFSWPLRQPAGTTTTTTSCIRSVFFFFYSSNSCYSNYNIKCSIVWKFSFVGAFLSMCFFSQSFLCLICFQYFQFWAFFVFALLFRFCILTWAKTILWPKSKRLKRNRLKQILFLRHMVKKVNECLQILVI